MRRKFGLSLSELPRLKFQVRTRAGGGFSLIEILGVLAIMGILAAMLAPNIIRQIRQSQATGEDARLRQVGEAIVDSILATGVIPNPNVVSGDAEGWFTLARGYSSMTEDAFRYVYANNPSSERRYFLDQALDAYLLGLSTPYKTPPDGFPVTGFPPGALRMLLVSSSRGTLNPPASDDAVLPFAFGANLDAADQDALRNWNKTFIDGIATVPTLPTTPFGANWNGLGEFLHVNSIDLRPFFCLVQLEDTRSPASATVGNSGSGYSGYGPSTLNTNGVTLSVYFSGSTNTNTFISSVGIASPPGRILWPVSGLNSPTNATFTNPITVFGGATNGTVNLAFPSTPSFAIQTNSLVLLSSQDISFYVIKGTTVVLGDSSLNPQKSVVIQDNSSFSFANGSWSRRD